MHIAQFIHRYPPALGGAEAYTARLSDYLAGCGDTIHVWTSSAIQLEEMWGKPLSKESHSQEICSFSSTEACAPFIKRYRPLSFPGRRYILKALSLIPFREWQCLTTPCNPVCLGMWKDAESYNGPLDAVHALAFPYSFPIVCGLRLAHRRNVPFYLTPFLHLGDPLDPSDYTRKQYTKPHLKWLLEQADGVFVQTRFERDAVIELGVDECRVFLQGLGVDPSECTGGDRERMRARLGIGPDEVVVGHFANNSAEKGTCDLLMASERLSQKGEKFRVVLAGPEMKNFKTFWETYRAKEKVMRLGVLSEKAKRDFFAAIDLFALPSRTDSFGLVLLEAWVNKKPNLVYRAGGPAELVRDGFDGLHALCGNVEHLSSQLGRLIADRKLRVELGENGFSRIDREFQWENKLALVRDVFAGRKLNQSSTTLVGNSKPRKRITARAE
jgi:glycosyltransferase involved in cell wall biosynthesis